jgi:hypothetical protein
MIATTIAAPMSNLLFMVSVLSVFPNCVLDVELDDEQEKEGSEYNGTRSQEKHL